MRKFVFAAPLLTILIAQGSLAHENPACRAIAKACIHAGYTRSGMAGKKFWSDCMKPILREKRVKDIKLNPMTIRNCRIHEIKRLKEKLNYLEHTS